MASNQDETSRIVLASVVKAARANFKGLVRSRKLEGSFDDCEWNYRGSNLIFRAHTTAKEACGMRLRGDAEALAKCYMITEIKKGVTPSCAIGRLNAFRMLARTMTASKRQWNTLSPSLLSSTVQWLRANYRESTVYNRSGGLVSFVAFISRVTAKVGEKQERFLRRPLNWKHGVRNPIREDEDPTSEKFIARRERMYRADIHTALGQARYMVTSQPDFEAAPGYDRIRLESLSFFLALGIRVGEACALPVNAYERDADTGLPFVRVPTEKASEPAAVPLAELWDEVVSGAYSYLLEICAPARKRAMDIEQSGFQFVYDGLLEFRRLNPLNDSQLCQLVTKGLDPDRHFLAYEWTKAFDVSYKEFLGEGRFKSALVQVAKPVAARAVVWLDERMESWDWNRFAKKRGRSDPADGCGISIFEHSGIPRATINKPSLWFKDELKRFLRLLANIGSFEIGSKPTIQEMKAVRICWKNLRANMLSHEGGSQSTFFNADEVVRCLRTQYDRWLEVHYQELIDTSLEDESAGRGKTKIGRSGMPQKLSDHLVVVWEGQFNSLKSNGIIPRPILRKDYYHYLSEGAGRQTIFQRLGIKGDDGKVVSISPHDIRRWLTTAVLRSGPSEVAVDLWMGRTPGQSRRYDYRTAKERAKFLREKYINADDPTTDFLGKKIRELRLNEVPEDRIEFLLSEKLRAVHFTPYGSCSSDLYTNPCGKGTACLRGFGTGEMCESFHIDTDDQEAKQAIKILLENNEMLLRKIEPHLSVIDEAILSEFGERSGFDQHLALIIDVIRGCRQALRIYEEARASVSLPVLLGS